MQLELGQEFWHMALQVIYTNQLNVTGEQTPRGGVVRETATKAKRGQREPTEEIAPALLNLARGGGGREEETETAMQTELGGESRRVKGNRPRPSR